jgi:hypothetical protein
MKKQMMTALGILLLGSSVAFASPQPRSSNFNQQQSNQTQDWQRRDNNSRNNAPLRQSDNRDPRHISQLQQARVSNAKHHRKHESRRFAQQRGTQVTRRSPYRRG